MSLGVVPQFGEGAWNAQGCIRMMSPGEPVSSITHPVRSLRSESPHVLLLALVRLLFSPPSVRGLAHSTDTTSRTASAHSAVAGKTDTRVACGVVVVVFACQLSFCLLIQAYFSF